MPWRLPMRCLLETQRLQDEAEKNFEAMALAALGEDARAIQASMSTP